jgi:hypothetical protein
MQSAQGKKNTYQPRFLMSTKILFITEGKIKVFQDKEKLRFF